MAQVELEEGGRLRLPAEVVRALGWAPGKPLHVAVEGDQLLVQPVTPALGIKEDARRLAAAMRGITTDALRQVTEAVKPAATVPAPEAATPAVSPRGLVGPFLGIEPVIAPSVYLAPGSTVLGDVVLNDEVSLWPGAVVRGDVAPVRVGARCNLQEGAVLHVSPHIPCVLGARVTVGHQATVHACTIADDVLIGIHAVVLDGAKVGRNCIIAAGTVVPPGMEIPEGKMVMGVPAKVVRDLTPEEIQRIHWNADSYVRLQGQYRNPDPVAAPTPLPPMKPSPPLPGALPRYECVRASGPITVDGSLDDPGWIGVQPTSALMLSNGQGNPCQPTEVKACWDDRNFYLSYSCKDTDIWGDLEHRDDPIYDEEVVEFFVSPTGDLRHYFEFEVSPCNVVFDARVFNPDGDRRTLLVDREWNANGLRTAVRVSGVLNDRSSPDIGWIVELALPWTDLGLNGPPASGTIWRANFFRIERGEVTEFTAWSPTYREPADFHVPESFGELVFVG